MSNKDYRVLAPLKTPEDFIKDIERRIHKVLWDEIYKHIIHDVGIDKNQVVNAVPEDLWEALNRGTVTYRRGKFSGDFNASITKQLKAIGAKWDRYTSTFRIQFDEIPKDLQQTILATENRFSEKIAGLDAKIRQIVPEEIARKISVSDLFDKTLFKADKEFRANVGKLTLSPTLSKFQRDEISRRWQNNLEIEIKKFTEAQIKTLRSNVRASVFAGNRYGSLTDAIKTSYGVSRSKAEFLARQETKLCTAEYHESSCKQAGINEYEWECVAGSDAHPVRKRHKELNGTTHSWDDPPITSEPGQKVRRNHPQKDFNCRCHARPIIRGRK